MNFTLILRTFRFMLFALPVSLVSCGEDHMLDCLKSTGSITSDNRNLEAFHTMQVEDNVDVWIIPDSETFVEVKAGSNLIENVTTEVSNGRLTIRNINKCNWVRDYDKPVEAWVHTPLFRNIYHLGSGKLTSTSPI